MQEIVSFSIKVKKKFPEVVAAVKEYFKGEDFVITKEDEEKGKNSWVYEEKERHIRWLKDVVYAPSKNMIYNYGEGWKMYEDDYYCIIGIGQFISEKVPDSEFEGHREYYCGAVGTVNAVDFTYKKGKYEETDNSPDEHGYDGYEDYDEEDDE